MFITFRLARPMLIILTILSVGFFFGLHAGMRGVGCGVVSAPPPPLLTPPLQLHPTQGVPK